MCEVATKVCTKCGQEKEFGEFSKAKKGKFGVMDICIICRNEYLILWNLKLNKKKFTSKIKTKKIVNKKCTKYKIKTKKIVNKKCTKCKIKKSYNDFYKTKKGYTPDCISCRKKITKQYADKKRKTDALFKLSGNLRNLIGYSIRNKGYTKISKTAQILGCSFDEFYAYIESQFEPWMNWQNYGKYNGEINFGWDIDHIIPTSSAITENDLIQLNHYTNLQPLCSKVNRDIKKNN